MPRIISSLVNCSCNNVVAVASIIIIIFSCWCVTLTLISRLASRKLSGGGPDLGKFSFVAAEVHGVVALIEELIHWRSVVCCHPDHYYQQL
jgi:hypothetical protein